jgi:hypothetical protein
MTTRKHPLEAKMPVPTVEETKSGTKVVPFFCCPMVTLTMLSGRPLAHTDACPNNPKNKR